MSEAAEGGEVKPKKSIPFATVALALNFLTILAGIGVLYYTRVLYKRPAITESKEREKLTSTHADRKSTLKPGFMHFETQTVNLKNEPKHPGVESLHYLTISFSLELKDESNLEEIQALKQRIADLVISMLGRKTADEMASVQGRYLLRTQMADALNELLMETQRQTKREEDPFITNVFFNQFTVQ